MIIPRLNLKTVILLFTFSICSLKLAGQEMGADEKKSMEKGNNAFKGGINGVKGAGLNLPPEKIEWWKDEKFGMFIHWGLYAIPATGEWTMFNQKSPADEYAKLADQFNQDIYSSFTEINI